VMGGKKEMYRDVRFFHGAIQLSVFRFVWYCSVWCCI